MELKWPKHEASLHLTHNQHKAYYYTVAESVQDEDHGYGSDCWASEEQKQKAIETNDCWMLQWYPNNPTSCFIVAAADLEVLLKAAIEQDDK